MSDHSAVEMNAHPMHVRIGTARQINPLLASSHYLGPLKSGSLILVGEVGRSVVAGQVWRSPTSRHLPADGTWLELSRWVLTPSAGDNAGSRFHAAAVRIIRHHLRQVTTLVSYSDPSVGHTGALYRACNWQWAPVWHRLRTPPTGQGSWGNSVTQAAKDRWVYPVRRDGRRDALLCVNDAAAIRAWARTADADSIRLALRSPAVDLRDTAKSLVGAP